jgi:hypothetical protein
VSLLGLSACASEPPPVEEEAKGTIALAFGFAESIRADAKAADATRGTIYGDLYPSEDVSVVGPSDEAVAVASIAQAVDLSSTDVSGTLWTSPELKPGRYTFLGFFDVNDKSTAAKRRPQTGDPVTLPFTNKFGVESGKPLSGTVYFDLLYN